MSKSNLPSTDFFLNLEPWKQHLSVLFILFLVPFFLFTASTIGGKELIRHDITQWRAGAESIIEHRAEFNEEPLWASDMFAGMPAYPVSVRNPIPHLDYFASFFGAIYPAFHFWVMLSGMYFLLILMRFGSLSSAFGSLLFSLTTYFPIIIAAGHNTKFITLSFIPWMFAGYWLLTRKEKKLPGLLLFTVAFVLDLRAGHPQITYYFFYLLVALWIFDTISAFKKSELKPWIITSLLLALGGLLGVLSYAPNFLPLQEYTSFSIRGGSALSESSNLDTGYAFAWSQGIKESLSFFVPDIYGGASPNYWGDKPGTSGPHYFGALTLLFMIVAFFKQKVKLVYLFFGVGVLGMFFAWGENFRILNETAMDIIPLFGKFRAPETWLVLTSFCFSIVAVYGFDWFLNCFKNKTRDIKSLYSSLGVTFAILVGIFFIVQSLSFSNTGEVDQIAQQIAQQNQVSVNNPQVRQQAKQYVNTNLIPSREEKAKGDLLRFGVILLLGGGIVFVTISKNIPTSYAAFALVAITAFDMISVGKRYIPDSIFVESNIDSESVILSQKRDLDEFIIENINSDQAYSYRVFPLLDNPFNNAVPSYFYPSIGGYSGAKLSVYQDIIGQNGPIFKGTSGINLDFLGLLNVKYLTYSPGLSLPGLTPVFEGQRGTVYENENLLPKAFFVDSVALASSPKDAFNKLNPGVIEFSKTAVVESSESLFSVSDTTSKVEVTTYRSNLIEMTTSRAKPGFLVLSEIYYPAGWVAELNGEEIPIHKTNYAFRGMEIPAGEHTITMKFSPQSYETGKKFAWISLALQILIGLVIVFNYFKQRSESAS